MFIDCFPYHSLPDDSPECFPRLPVEVQVVLLVRVDTLLRRGAGKPLNGLGVNVTITHDNQVLSVLWLPGMSLGKDG